MISENVYNMYTIKIIYNSILENNFNPLDLKKVLEDFIPEDHIVIYDESNYSKDRKKALQVKNTFGARLAPFVGFYKDKKTIRGFYSEDNSCTIEKILEYCTNTMEPLPKKEMPKNPLDGIDTRTMQIMAIKDLSKEEFLEKYQDEELYNDIHNSKSGHIKITKVSDNPGYLGKGGTREGFTPAFGEGISCYISCLTEYYYTSIITKIDWENNVFYTLNSKYSFEFNESTDSESKDKET